MVVGQPVRVVQFDQLVVCFAVSICNWHRYGRCMVSGRCDTPRFCRIAVGLLRGEEFVVNVFCYTGMAFKKYWLRWVVIDKDDQWHYDYIMSEKQLISS